LLIDDKLVPLKRILVVTLLVFLKNPFCLKIFSGLKKTLF